MLDILELKLKEQSINFRIFRLYIVGSKTSAVGCWSWERVDRYQLWIVDDTPFSPPINAITELSIDVPTKKLYVWVWLIHQAKLNQLPFGSSNPSTM